MCLSWRLQVVPTSLAISCVLLQVLASEDRSLSPRKQIILLKMSDGRLCNAKSVSMVQCHVQCTQSMRQASVGWPGQILSGVHLAFLQSDLNYPADHTVNFACGHVAFRDPAQSPFVATQRKLTRSSPLRSRWPSEVVRCMYTALTQVHHKLRRSASHACRVMVKVCIDNPWGFAMRHSRLVTHVQCSCKIHKTLPHCLSLSMVLHYASVNNYFVLETCLYRLFPNSFKPTLSAAA